MSVSNYDLDIDRTDDFVTGNASEPYDCDPYDCDPYDFDRIDADDFDDLVTGNASDESPRCYEPYGEDAPEK